MNHLRRRLIAGAALAAMASRVAWSQAYPAKPIKLVVPYAPGGSADVLGRVVGRHLSELWSQQVVIDNRPGANGILGTEFAAKQPPDGYTLYLGTDSQNSINPSIYASVPYHWPRDFAPVSLLATMTQVMLVPTSLPVQTVQELIALAKQRPGQLNYASIGIGSTPHLEAELFNSMTGVNIVHVPYKSAGQTVTALLTGEAQVLFTSESTALPHIKSGKVRAIASVGRQRTSGSPDVPTLIESGLPGYEMGSWYGLLVPIGTADDIIRKLHADTVKALESNDLRALLGVAGLEARPSSPEEFRAFAQRDAERQAELIRKLGIKPQ
ncbi:MAG: Bug family tripartite tricarboxylate transporter substrate binding protein [Burkholderiales bacterium]